MERRSEDLTRGMLDPAQKIEDVLFHKSLYELAKMRHALGGRRHELVTQIKHVEAADWLLQKEETFYGEWKEVLDECERREDASFMRESLGDVPSNWWQSPYKSMQGASECQSTS